MNIFKKYFKRNTKGNKNIKKFLLIAFVLNLIQLSLVSILIVYSGESNKLKIYSNEGYYLVYSLIILIIFNVIITLTLYCFVFYKKNDEYIKENLDNIQNLNRKLREQRHDYLNHIQVIYGLLELEEFKEAKNYIGATCC
ncbi:Spo0B domain-containing protein [Clostridium tarantellae]|uniref:SpoOB alpha-helical domain-containing protein n=1 Tax=Clostridium tarantellae TaxID=39493 RepID=A0A6I1MKI2_9CLOT|nr:Spo0B domain-containing protein [Clostridium tarantellae]MPQ43484.1 hypothetical protein [Clostridium tarantellae]